LPKFHDWHVLTKSQAVFSHFILYFSHRGSSKENNLAKKKRDLGIFAEHPALGTSSYLWTQFKNPQALTDLTQAQARRTISITSHALNAASSHPYLAI
jgi:hypothetical protein